MKPLAILFLSFFLLMGVHAQKLLSPVQIAERNKPGTVMIQATFKGTVSALQPQTNIIAARKLADGIKEKLENEGRYSEHLFWNNYLMAFCKNIDQYLYSGTTKVSRELNTTIVGSGFVITPDGYVVTNAHVVDENDETTRKSFVEQAFKEILREDAERVEKTMGRKLTQDEAQALSEANTWYFSQTLQVGAITKAFNIVMGVSDTTGKIIPMKIPAELITRGNTIPGKDVAILKLTEKHVYPTIRLGNDKDMRVGDQVYVLGYPAVATFHPLLSAESISEATLTRGLVSAKKNMKDGWEVLQTDASITHGNSGGPVMNEQGEVIGLATFGSIDRQRGQEVQGMNFIVPSTIVNEYINKIEVVPEMSKVSLTYESAMDLFDKSRYKKALHKFKAVQKMNPSFPFIGKMISDTEEKIDRGLDKGSNSFYTYCLVIALLLILAWFIYFLLKRKEEPAN